MLKPLTPENCDVVASRYSVANPDSDYENDLELLSKHIYSYVKEANWADSHKEEIDDEAMQHLHLLEESESVIETLTGGFHPDKVCQTLL